MGPIIFKRLTEASARETLPALIAVSADVSPWGEREFMSDLPDKWSLSFTAWQDGALVGYCILSTRFSPTVPHIHQFMVTKDRRGHGVGVKMLAHARKDGVVTLKVAKDNTGAIRFYKREGMAVLDRDGGDYLWLNG